MMSVKEAAVFVELSHVGRFRRGVRYVSHDDGETWTRVEPFEGQPPPRAGDLVVTSVDESTGCVTVAKIR